jgi:hypothetical protein
MGQVGLLAIMLCTCDIYTGGVKYAYILAPQGLNSYNH